MGLNILRQNQTESSNPYNSNLPDRLLNKRLLNLPVLHVKSSYTNLRSSEYECVLGVA